MESKPGEYEFFDHTADAKFRAYGKTPAETFRNAARATFAIITDVEKVKPKLEQKIWIKAKNKEAALFDFLDQLLFLLDTEGFLLHDLKEFRVTRNCDGSFWVTGVALGDHHKGYDVSCNVKAVTYSEMKWEVTPEGFMAQVVVDL